MAKKLILIRSGTSLVLLALAAILGGCATTKSYQIYPGKERPAFDKAVLIYDQRIPPEVQYTVIGEFKEQTDGVAAYGSSKKSANGALSAAAAKGANGILIETRGHKLTAWSFAMPYSEGKLLWISNYEVAAALQNGTRPIPEANNSPAPSPANTTAEPAVARRLKDLESLHSQGLISDPEYQTKRKAILDSL